MAKVRVIPSTINPVTLSPLGQLNRRKVAAYARVSTVDEEQATSYETQVKHYTEFIQKKPEWEFVKVYADDGISGTSTKRREGFNQMIKDALEGKIDLIITKSISRFARNTLDTISYTRKLKAKGIEVYFEKENLWSLDDKTEFLLTIMASMAQEESRSISQNVTMGKRWAMKEGRVGWAYSSMLGYKKVGDKIEIIQEEAELVQQIYKIFLREGKTCTGIAEYLKERGVKTPTGKSTNWTKNTVNSILRNEKYKGDALLQKTYTVDYLEHRIETNKGHLPQYYVENSHPAIINREEWEIVQAELTRRETLGAAYSGNSEFSSKLICGDCGGFYGRKLWHSNDKYRRVMYQCNSKYSGKEKCKTPAIRSEDIESRFVNVVNILIESKDEIISNLEKVLDKICNKKELLEEKEKLENSLTEQVEKIQDLIDINSRVAQNQEKYKKEYDALIKNYDETKCKFEQLEIKLSQQAAKHQMIKDYINTLKKQEKLLTKFDGLVWGSLLESATIKDKDVIVFRFKDGTEING